MKLWNRIHILWPLLFFLTGCSGNRDLKISPTTLHAKVEQSQGEEGSSKGDLFVLLPEPNGNAGSIRVATAGGFQILDKPGDMTRVEDFNRPPILPRPLDEKGVASIFSEALSAQPTLAPRFVSFTLWFESDKTKFSNGSKETLSEILKTINIRKPKEIHIVGHTDRVGTDSHNLKLSSRRANFVRDFLTSKGIKSNILLVSFYGKSRPLVYTEDEVAEPLNRRVEVLIR